jgi:hypothetical protein
MEVERYLNDLQQASDAADSAVENLRKFIGTPGQREQDILRALTAQGQAITAIAHALREISAEVKA